MANGPKPYPSRPHRFPASENGKACRMDQLFAASANVINAARRASAPFETDAARHAALVELHAAIEVFDRLNGGI